MPIVAESGIQDSEGIDVAVGEGLLRNRSDSVPTSPRTHVPSPPCRTVSTRIGSLKSEPLSIWPSHGVGSADTGTRVLFHTPQTRD